jgi:hypothetical protein
LLTATLALSRTHVKGTRKYESIGLYLIPEKTPLDKADEYSHPTGGGENQGRPYHCIAGNEASNSTRRLSSRIVFARLAAQVRTGEFGFRPSTLKGRVDMRKKVEEYLEQQKTTLYFHGEVDADFCRGFLRFLATAKKYVVQSMRGLYLQDVSHHHQAVFNGALNKAVREGLLTANR